MFSLGLHTRVNGELASSLTNPFEHRFQLFGDFFSGLEKLMPFKSHNCPSLTKLEVPCAPPRAAYSCVFSGLLCLQPLRLLLVGPAGAGETEIQVPRGTRPRGPLIPECEQKIREAVGHS